MIKKLFIVLVLLIPELLYAQNELKSVGILRADGIVMPLAIRTASVWKEVARDDLLEFEEMLPTWYLVADSTTAINISTMVIFNPYSMEEGTGFISSYVPDFTIYGRDQIESVVYTWVPSAVVGFENNNLTRADGEDIAKMVKLKFETEEENVVQESVRDEIDGVSYANYIPIEYRLRDSLEIKATIYKSEMSLSGKRISYVSAQRFYPRDKCQFKSVLTAWIIERPDVTPLIQKRSFESGYCDDKSMAGYALPVEAFELDDKIYVIFQSWGYEGGGLSISEIDIGNSKQD